MVDIVFVLWNVSVGILFKWLNSEFSLFRFCNKVCVVFLLISGIFGILLDELFIRVRKLIISLGGMLYFLYIFCGFKIVLFIVLIRVIFGVINCVIFLLLVLINMVWFVFLVFCVKVLIILLVLILEIINKGSFIVLIIWWRGLIWVCKLLGMGGWWDLYFVKSLLWNVLFLVLKIMVIWFGWYCSNRLCNMFNMLYIVFVGLFLLLVSGGKVW